MKTLNNYISEALIKKDTKISTWNYFPKTKEELRSLIEQLLKERGKDADLNDINTSNITDMSALFYKLDPHNIHIEDWDVSNVETMEVMFCGCNVFNSDLSKWNTIKVKTMAGLFRDCFKFNSDLSKWNVSNVKDMGKMFYKCKSFNSDLSKWDVSNVKYIHVNDMFYSCILLKNKPDWYEV